MINLIFAIAEDGTIGCKGRIPWHCKEDLQNFKKLTTGQTVLMGRKTYESIGKPLPNRKNIVLTHDEEFIKAHQNDGDNIEFITEIQLKDLIKYERDSNNHIFVIGGLGTLKSVLNTSKNQNMIFDRLYITDIKGKFDGDVKLYLNEYFNLDRWYIVIEEIKLSEEATYKVYQHRLNC